MAVRGIPQAVLDLRFLKLDASNDPITGDLTIAADVLINQDSKGLKLGAGQDMSVYYDGINGNIDTDLVGASDLVIDCGTDKTVVLEETVYDDINIGGTQLTQAVANQPSKVTLNTSNVIAYSFVGNVGVSELHGSFELAHDYKEGTNLLPHAHFYLTSTGAGDVKIYLDYYIADGETGNTVSTGTLSDVATATGTAWNQLFFDFGSITGTNFVIGAQIHFRIYRDAGDVADTYGDGVVLGTFGVHYEIDTVGSRQTIIK